MKTIQALGLLLAFAGTQTSASVVYNYVGNPFTEINNVSFPGENIAASLTLTDGVGPSFTGVIKLVPLSSEFVSLVLTSGPNGIALDQSVNSSIEVNITNGQIVNWSMTLANLNNIVLSTQNSVQGDVQDFVTISNEVKDFNLVPNAAGVWTRVSAVPVPASVWLLGSAVYGMGVKRRRRVG